jgi:two-component system, OmpR family, phosphate regulon response regulator PhoB
MGQAHFHQLSAEPPRLLLIEPNRVYLGVIARRLGECGFRVATARNAQDGLAELHRIPVDLVLSELRLPGTSGVELVRMMREDSSYRHLPVLLIVGRSDRKASVAGFEAGADGLIRKPFHFEVLAARIMREIERARAIESLRHDNAALDARVISRAIELGEMRSRWEASEAERRRLETAARDAA